MNYGRHHNCSNQRGVYGHPVIEVSLLFFGVPDLPVGLPYGAASDLARISIGPPSGLVSNCTHAFLFTQRYVLGADGQPRPTENWVNCNQAKRRQHVYDHRSRLTSVAEIEALTGLTFFPGALNRERARTAVPTTLWPVPQKYWDPNGCAGQNFVP